ncbi:50S ribosomal protein L33 [archaeon]|nr:MAG: 50S ribosomal protein L33 [archaeon]
MAKGKLKSMAIKLLSTASTGFFYVTTKNPRNVQRKLSLMKVPYLSSVIFIRINTIIVFIIAFFFFL